MKGSVDAQASDRLAVKMAPVAMGRLQMSIPLLRRSTDQEAAILSIRGFARAM
jgi:hypothetical protein